MGFYRGLSSEESPCYQCKLRSATCHAGCTPYLEYSKKERELSAAVSRDRAQYRYLQAMDYFHLVAKGI